MTSSKGNITSPAFPLVFLFPSQQNFTIRRPSSFTRHCSFRLAPIDENSLLLPPVGVWAVSQSQCGRSPSQAGYARRLGEPLPHQPANAPQVHPCAEPCSSFNKAKMPSLSLSGISIRFRKLSRPHGQVPYVLLTRSPLGIRRCLVRLACIRHAASVHPEPGSNSPFDIDSFFVSVISFFSFQVFLKKSTCNFSSLVLVRFFF